jgi:hypothetical protein
MSDNPTGEDMRVPTIFAAASLILVTASATACSGGSGPASAAPPASAASTGSSTGAGAASTGAGGASATGNAGTSSSGQSLDVCKALPAAAASQITGTTFTTTKSSNTEGVIFNCEYDGPDSALLQISVQTQGGKEALDLDVSTLKTVGHAPTPVSGVGDEAFSEPDPKGNAGSVGASSFASYGAVFGSTYIQIGGLTYVTAAQGKQIVEELHSKL